MTRKARRSPHYTAFIVIMIVIILIGLFMMVYGSLHNGLPAPTLPGASPLSRALLPHV